MEKDQLRRIVEAFEPIFGDEELARQDMLVALDRLDEPFSETSDPLHFTASSIVVGPRGTVLHLHKRLGLWLQPGGHVDPGEEPYAAAVRETWEETGLVASGTDELFSVDAHDSARGHRHLDLRYLLRVDDDEAVPRPPEGESQDVAWFDWDAALERAGDPALRACLLKAKWLIGRPNIWR